MADGSAYHDRPGAFEATLNAGGDAREIEDGEDGENEQEGSDIELGDQVDQDMDSDDW